MNIVSLFDGMGCLAIALQDMGIKVNKYYSSEIDKFANIQTKANFPNIIQLGDVTKWQEWNIDWSKIDLIGAGSPCQGFSFAGKQLAFNDPRSALFFVFVEILNHAKKHNPNVKFLLENVDMKKDYLRIISEYVGLFPVNLNSNRVSAQNRNRWYWTNIKVKKVGLFEELYTDIPEPEDRGILLKDILESDVPEKYYLSDKMINYFKNRGANFNNGKVNVREEEGKVSCLTSSMASCDISDNFIKVDTNLKKSTNQDKASCFTAGGNSGGNHSDMDIICVAMRERESTCLTPKRTEYGKEIRKEYEKGLIKEQRKNIQQLEPREDGKTNTLTSVSKDNLIMQINPSTESGGKQPYQQNRVYSIEGQMPALMSEFRGNILDDYKLRRLTPTECARLQTIPEWYKWIVSDTQIFSMLGNGFTIKVIMHILSHNDWTACKF